MGSDETFRVVGVVGDLNPTPVEIKGLCLGDVYQELLYLDQPIFVESFI